jgi:hypothetical protein
MCSYIICETEQNMLWIYRTRDFRYEFSQYPLGLNKFIAFFSEEKKIIYCTLSLFLCRGCVEMHTDVDTTVGEWRIHPQLIRTQ